MPAPIRVANASGYWGDDPGRLTAERIALFRASDEGQEGLSAFLEKRAPRWVP